MFSVAEDSNRFGELSFPRTLPSPGSSVITTEASKINAVSWSLSWKAGPPR